MIIDEELYLEHYGVRGMHWGIRRDPKTGVRPIAKALNEGPAGRASKANVDRYEARRRARINLTPGQQKRLDSSVRVAQGKASVSDTLRVASHQSLVSIIRGHGLKGAAARDAEKFKARQKRLKNGKDVTKNILTRQGTYLFNFGGTK